METQYWFICFHSIYLDQMSNLIELNFFGFLWYFNFRPSGPFSEEWRLIPPIFGLRAHDGVSWTSSQEPRGAAW